MLGEGSTPYVWLGKYISRVGVVPQKHAADIVTPLKTKGLSNLLKRLQRCAGTMDQPIVRITYYFQKCLFKKIKSPGRHALRYMQVVTD